MIGDVGQNINAITTMSIFTDIEKLITEHGSAAILKERLALASDKYSALEEQVAKLRAENKSLKLQFNQSEQENQRLKKQIQNNLHGGIIVSEDMRQILLLLAKYSEMDAIDIARTRQIHIEKAKLILDDMEKLKLIWAQGYINRECEWRLNDTGRRFLVEHDLI